jgi:preprotein translocase SecE subunit
MVVFLIQESFVADESKKKRRVIKKTETVRERASKPAPAKKKRRIRTTAAGAAKPFRAARKVGKKEYHLPLPDNRLGRILSFRVRLFPRFFGNAWRELRQVEWPGPKETTKLTFAVFIFAIAFGAVIAVTDYGLDKVFKKVLLK